MKLGMRIVTSENAKPYPEFYDCVTGEVLEKVIGCTYSVSVHEPAKATIELYLHDPFGDVYAVRE